MSEIDSWWLSFWEWFATIGFVLVIVGCIIEGVEHFVKFKRTESQKRKGIEKLGWLILVGGLAMEFLGDKQAKRISDTENRRLTVEAATARRDAANANAQSGEANERAGIANKLAGEANERAATNEVARARLEKEVETLQKENLELFARIQPRRVTAEQKAILFRELSGLPNKCKVSLIAQVADAEASIFMLQIRDALVQCGFDAKGITGVLLSPSSDLPLGVSFFIKGPLPGPPGLSEIVRAFLSAGIPITPPGTVFPDPQMSDDTLSIHVNAKPVQ